MAFNDFMEESELFELLGKKKTAVWRLRKDHGFPNPVLTYPSRYSRKAVIKWLEDGGINRTVWGNWTWIYMAALFWVQLFSCQVGMDVDHYL